MKDKIVELVRSDLLKRSEKGISKYGTTLEGNKLSKREWLQHAYEECLDQANYLKCCILEEEKEEFEMNQNFQKVMARLNTDEGDE